ncbi:MAG: VOC family protein [Micromonosporaceae bacterium]
MSEDQWPPTLTPYVAVPDARRALQWYSDVLGATPRGEPYEMPDGSIGHAEVGIGNAVLMFADSTDGVPVAAPSGGGPHSHTLHLQVADTDATTARAAAHGAQVERQPEDQPYGRVAVIVDPFGHRWMFNTPPAGDGNPAAAPG